MTHPQLKNLVKFFINKGYEVFAPQKSDKGVFISKIEDPKKVQIIPQLPFFSFKEFLVPQVEVLFNYKNNRLSEPKNKFSPQVLFGVNLLDLKAIQHSNIIFRHDPYYQKRLKNTIIIGQNTLKPDADMFFLEDFEEDTLEHLEFDIFLAVIGKKYRVFTGSEDGQRLLDNFGYKDYENVEYVGPFREEVGQDPDMLLIKEKMQFSHEQELWDELGKICIECGKCSMVCPTCYCFNIYDEASLEKKEGQRKRCWTACFYNEFSQVAGPAEKAPKHTFLKDTVQKIHYWYYHKFVRTPEHHQIMGCVGCGRCTRVCPVDINIAKNLVRIKKSEKS